MCSTRKACVCREQRELPQWAGGGSSEPPRGCARAAAGRSCVNFFVKPCLQCNASCAPSARKQRAHNAPLHQKLQSLKRATCTNTTSLFYCLLSLRGAASQRADAGKGEGGEQDW